MFQRNSVLRAQGLNPRVANAGVIARAKSRRIAADAATLRATITAVREVTSAVNTPNGTTKKIARLVEAV
jgi:hypothetical protein